ncbi:MAG TPA: hypothetical protein VF276_11805 [Chloroflexia bacterium]
MSLLHRNRHLVFDAGREIALAEREIREGRFQRSMALIAAFSAIVSGFEAYVQHQRGAFSHWLMWTPVWLTPPTALVSAVALVSERVARRVLPVIALVSLADGVIGFWYHLRGIGKLPGGWKLGQYNIVMGPPIFAPLLTCMVGLLAGLAGLLRRERVALPAPEVVRARDAIRRLVQREDPPSALDQFTAAVAHGRFQRRLALTSAFFAILAGGEAYFEHLRGSFNQRVMWTPVWVTPFMVLAAVGAAASERMARRVLPVVSLVTLLDGMLGFLLHLRGIRQMPGGFANLRFNITMGPPLFAPLLFSSVGLLGFVAALLRRKEH